MRSKKEKHCLFKHSVEVGQRARPSNSYHPGSPAHSGKTDKKEYVDHLDPPPRLKLLADGEELPADLVRFRNLWKSAVELHKYWSTLLATILEP